MDIDGAIPRIYCSGGAVWLPAANILNAELWLSLFLYISADCPFHSFSALLDISCVSRTAAIALAGVRAEHLRLLLISLDVEMEMDIDHEMAQQAADDFFDSWSVDSDGHWHDRFDDRQ